MLKFNLLQSIVCFTKAIFLSLFPGMLCSSVIMTDSHNHDYTTRICLVLVSFFLLYSQTFVVVKLSNPWKGELPVCGRLRIFVTYPTTLKQIQKSKALRLKNEHFPHLKEKELHVFEVTYILYPIRKIQNLWLGTKQEILYYSAYGFSLFLLFFFSTLPPPPHPLCSFFSS